MRVFSYIFIGVSLAAAISAGALSLAGAEEVVVPGGIDVPSEVKRAVPAAAALDENFSIQISECFLPVAAAYGYELRVTSGFRSFEEQEAAYEQGRTADGHIVTEAPPGKSLHNFGFAIDVVDRRRGYRIDWERLGRIGEYCGLEWGGEGDEPHFEHRAGLSADWFAAGYRPPTLVLPCALLQEHARAGEPLTRDDLVACGAEGI